MIDLDERLENIIQMKAKKLSEALSNGALKDYADELEDQKSKLVSLIADYKEKYEQLKADQADIYFYLNKKLDDNFEIITSLENQLLTEQNEREITEKEYERKIDELKTKISVDESRNDTEIKLLKERLDILKSFSEQKDGGDKNLEKLMTTLENERRQFQRAAEEMENRTVLERERLRQEKEMDFERYKKEMQIQIEDRFSTDTRKTRDDNFRLKTELAYQSLQAEKVAAFNSDIVTKDRDLRRSLEISQSTELEMGKRLVMYQRLVKQLNEKMQLEEAQSKAVIEKLQRQLSEKQVECEQASRPTTRDRNSRDPKEESEDEFWNFVYEAFQSIRRKRRHLSQSSVSFVSHQSVTSSLKSQSIDHSKHISGDEFAEVDREGILSELFRKIMQHDPGRLRRLLRPVSQGYSRKAPALFELQNILDDMSLPDDGSGATPHPAPHSPARSWDSRSKSKGGSLRSVTLLSPAKTRRSADEISEVSVPAVATSDAQTQTMSSWGADFVVPKTFPSMKVSVSLKSKESVPPERDQFDTMSSEELISLAGTEPDAGDDLVCYSASSAQLSVDTNLFTGVKNNPKPALSPVRGGSIPSRGKLRVNRVLVPNDRAIIRPKIRENFTFLSLNSELMALHGNGVSNAHPKGKGIDYLLNSKRKPLILASVTPTHVEKSRRSKTTAVVDTATEVVVDAKDNDSSARDVDVMSHASLSSRR